MAEHTYDNVADLLAEFIGIDWSDIPRRAAKTGDQNLGFDESGNWIRFDSNLIDTVITELVTDVSNLNSLMGVSPESTLWPAFPGDILPPNQTLYQLLVTIETAIANAEGGNSAAGQESVAIAGGVATLTATPNGDVIGVTEANVILREGSHFTRDGRTITISTWGTPAQPYADDGNATWLYPIASAPDRKFDDVPIVSGQAQLLAVPVSTVIGITAANVVLREGSHFTVDEAGLITIGTHGDPAQPHADDGEATWVYSTAAASSGGDTNRGVFEFANADGTEVNVDAVAAMVILADNTNDTFTLVGNCSTIIVTNERDDLKTIAGAEVGGQTTAILGKIDGVWRVL